MPLTISDDDLNRMGMTAEQARVEIACILFDAGKLHLWPAAQLAELSRVDFEGQLKDRKIPIYRFTKEDLEAEIKVLDELARQRSDKDSGAIELTPISRNRPCFSPSYAKPLNSVDLARQAGCSHER